MSNPFEDLFKSIVAPYVRTPIAHSYREQTVLVNKNVTVFDGLNNELSDLIELEAQAKARHIQTQQAIANYKAELRLQYESQIQSINELFPEENQNV